MYKGTFTEYLLKALSEAGEWCKVIDGETVRPESLVVCCLDGVAMKVRATPSSEGKDWRHELDNQWQWYGQAGKAIHAVDRLVREAICSDLPVPRKWRPARKGADPDDGKFVRDWRALPAEEATDSYFRDAYVEFEKSRRKNPDGSVRLVIYKLKKGARLALRPTPPRWRWRGHVRAIRKAIRKAEAAFSRAQRKIEKAASADDMTAHGEQTTGGDGRGKVQRRAPDGPSEKSLKPRQKMKKPNQAAKTRRTAKVDRTQIPVTPLDSAPRMNGDESGDEMVPNVVGLMVPRSSLVTVKRRRSRSKPRRARRRRR
jgi:hypothetical protein